MTLGRGYLTSGLLLLSLCVGLSSTEPLRGQPVGRILPLMKLLLLLLYIYIYINGGFSAGIQLAGWPQAGAFH